MVQGLRDTQSADEFARPRHSCQRENSVTKIKSGHGLELFWIKSVSMVWKISTIF